MTMTALTPPEWDRWYCHHKECNEAYWYGTDLATHLMEVHGEPVAR